MQSESLDQEISMIENVHQYFKSSEFILAIWQLLGDTISILAIAPSVRYLWQIQLQLFTCYKVQVCLLQVIQAAEGQGEKIHLPLVQRLPFCPQAPSPLKIKMLMHQTWTISRVSSRCQYWNRWKKKQILVRGDGKEVNMVSSVKAVMSYVSLFSISWFKLTQG